MTDSAGEGASDPTIIVAGPTASGKSALALALAEAFDGTVINADSMQVYRELRIVTARPGAAEEARAPHRLYGILPAAEVCSVGRWRDLALAEIAAVHGAGRLPIVTGGSGLYLEALTGGIAPIPDIPDHVRAAARSRHAEIGGAAFHAELAARDGEMAARLAPGDSQRVIRAREVLDATGISLADWQRRGAPGGGLGRGLGRGLGGGLGGPVLTLVSAPGREALYAACDARFRDMIEAGALDEVAALDALGLDPALPAMKALGVRELGRHLAGETGLDEAIAAAQQSTRNYAKRQLTWLRSRMAAAVRIADPYGPGATARILRETRGFLLTLSG